MVPESPPRARFTLDGGIEVKFCGLQVDPGGQGRRAQHGVPFVRPEPFPDVSAAVCRLRSQESVHLSPLTEWPFGWPA